MQTLDPNDLVIRPEDDEIVRAWKLYGSSVRNLSGEEISAVEADPSARPGDSALVAHAKQAYVALQALGFGVIDMRAA